MMAGDTDNGETEIALSIEDTNALRIKLGLKPLTEGNKTAKQEEAEENYVKHKEELAKAAQRKALIDRVSKETEKAKRNRQLEGKTLGEASDEDDSTADSLEWVRKQKEREEKQKAKAKRKQLELAKKKASELMEMDEAATSSYTPSHLKGLRVDHSLEDIAGGGETILTLKDATIMENEEEGDILHNVNIADMERNRKNLENKKKKPGYNLYDDEEFNAPGEKRNLLSQYDEELDGPKRNGFVISEEGTVDLDQKRKEVSEKLRTNAVSLSYEKTQEIKDYYTQEEMVSFKKPKKKKKVRRERKQLDFDALDEEAPIHETVVRDHGSRRRGRTQEDDRMDIDEVPRSSRDAPQHSEQMDYELSNRNANIEDVNFVDDDDLQSALARARRLQAQKRSKSDVEEIAKAAREIKEDDTVEEGAVVLSATSEFVRNLATAPVVKATEPARTNRPALPKEDLEEEPANTMEVDDEDQEEKGGWDHERERSTKSLDSSVEDVMEQDDGDRLPAPIEEEPLVASGLAATVALLSQKGFVEKASAEVLERERKQSEKRAWLAEQRKRDLLREIQKEKEKERNKERNKARGGGDRDRDWYREEQEARYAERERAREVEERFRHYIPDVNLDYHDEYGRKLNAKEAFRQLSHKFHGKASGKMKTEKRLKKIEDELKMEKMSSTDTPLGTANALLERTKAAGAAHVVLSVGNRGVLPADVALAEAKPAKPARQARANVTTTTVVDTDRNVNTYNREKVTFGLGAGTSSGASKRKQSSDDGPVSKRFKEEE
ncbi:U4/U6-U5 snRNP complex subunit SNU66 [Spizellomyces punctatus DAOM BR117]|uniref:SART-1 protein n=1 Tax=Spizellomyces punctatus (strain DAOM BR117) TaxID=645134 RepID=A0A0L0H5Z8_SPIPD|nr:U4/U6-U5 snRNP complex subunit SNU66 [Spizellomyces punctatus DAOM BR117]KNC96399.1 hypothetical protein SPPG_08298 [Spizellomyces punctatus DAOM BR117]|eukprot:XP_016604439.1 hypothetical protein SPPG_08298 [Spizellomyces punctatus DAOM BR117]